MTERTLNLADYRAVTAHDDDPDHIGACVERFLRAQLRTGGWHPEDDPADMRYVGAPGTPWEDSVPTFTPACADAVREDVRRIYAAGMDACGLALAAAPSHLPRQVWTDPT